MYNKSRSRLVRFIHSALCVWERNPSFNLPAICTIIGLATLSICGLIQACGYGIAPDYVVDIGQMAFSFGIGGAVERSKTPKEEEE